MEESNFYKINNRVLSKICLHDFSPTPISYEGFWCRLNIGRTLSVSDNLQRRFHAIQDDFYHITLNSGNNAATKCWVQSRLACSRLSVSEDDRKKERATSGIRDLSFFPTRPHSSPARSFNPPLTESLEQAKSRPVDMLLHIAFYGNNVVLEISVKKLLV